MRLAPEEQPWSKYLWGRQHQRTRIGRMEPLRVHFLDHSNAGTACVSYDQPQVSVFKIGASIYRVEPEEPLVPLLGWRTATPCEDLLCGNRHLPYEREGGIRRIRLDDCSNLGSGIVRQIAVRHDQISPESDQFSLGYSLCSQFRASSLNLSIRTRRGTGG